MQLALLALALLLPGCGGKAGPTSPDGTLFPTGTWAGTLTRPGLAPIPVVWVATRGAASDEVSSGSFTGPLTLTVASGPLTLLLSGNLGGSNDALTGYRFNFDVSLAPGGAAAFPTCGITSTANEAPSNLYDNSTTITTAGFQLFYSNCAGLVASGSRTFVVETGVLLTLSRQ